MSSSILPIYSLGYYFEANGRIPYISLNYDKSRMITKKKEKLIEDKTFGLKNKQGAKRQKFIQQVTNQENREYIEY
ncbi:unnamed protein product [Brugia pahangi]|uniref:Uncharacterized protein n=1 Tax=Brugia pahangi TaxID=6280 RepID=A0A0N4TXN2_BRUPA|nr:unnamed protein product [Brugia pahangi]